MVPVKNVTLIANNVVSLLLKRSRMQLIYPHTIVQCAKTQLSFFMMASVLILALRDILSIYTMKVLEDSDFWMMVTVINRRESALMMDLESTQHFVNFSRQELMSSSKKSQQLYSLISQSCSCSLDL